MTDFLQPGGERVILHHKPRDLLADSESLAGAVEIRVKDPQDLGSFHSEIFLMRSIKFVVEWPLTKRSGFT